MQRVLIVSGSIGAGKTTVATALAARYGAVHLSSDALRHNRSHGFDRMADALDDALTNSRLVVLDSTGMSFRFRALAARVREHALHVHLTVDAVHWEARERTRTDRPPLDHTAYGRSSRTVFERAPDMTLDTSLLDPADVIERVASAWERGDGTSPRARNTLKLLRYDPFVRGSFPVGVRTIHARDDVRRRVFPCEIWYPAAARHAGEDLAPEYQDRFTVRDVPRSQTAVRDASARRGTYPLIVFSHYSGGHRRVSTFLCTHLSSHGYVVAALDHSEIAAPELARADGESTEQKAARIDAVIANRVPDVRFLVNLLLDGAPLGSETQLDALQVGVLGHSFGGWTVLAATAEEPRIRAVVALAPAGNSQPRPGILPVKLTFDWGRDVPTLYLVAENDVSIPLPGVYELFERTRATKRMVVLRQADHLHFVDNVEEEHERVRGMTFTGELAWISNEMRPIAELCSGEQAHVFVRGLTVCHMDAVLKGREEAQHFFAGDVQGALADRGVDAFVHCP